MPTPAPFEYGDLRSSDKILALKLHHMGIDSPKELVANAVKHGLGVGLAKPCPPAPVPRNKDLLRKQAQLNVTIAGLL